MHIVKPSTGKNNKNDKALIKLRISHSDQDRYHKIDFTFTGSGTVYGTSFLTGAIIYKWDFVNLSKLNKLKNMF